MGAATENVPTETMELCIYVGTFHAAICLMSEASGYYIGQSVKMQADNPGLPLYFLAGLCYTQFRITDNL